MSHIVCSIKKDLNADLTLLIEILGSKECEVYDDVVNRFNYGGKNLIDLGFHTLNQYIVELVSENCAHMSDSLCVQPQYLEYNLAKGRSPYYVDRHNDNSHITVLIYWKKDETINDEFFIEGKKVNEQLWNKEKESRCIIMWKERNGIIDVEGPEHNAIIRGVGNRELISFFIYK